MRRARRSVAGRATREPGTVIEAEPTVAEVVPATAALRPLAAEVRARGHESAEAAGRGAA